MRLRDANRLALRNLGKNKSRTYMTVFATAIGCAFLIVLASFGYGVQKGVVDSIAGERLLNQITVHTRRVLVEGQERHRQPDVGDIAEMEALPGVKAVTRVTLLGQSPAFSLEAYRGVTRVHVVHFPAEEASGRELYAGRMPQAAHEVMVGYHFASVLKADEEITASLAASQLLDRELEMELRQYFGDEEEKTSFTVKIVGISQAPSREWEQDPKVYISEDLLHEIEQFTQTRDGHLLDPRAPSELREQLGLNGEPRSYRVNVYTHRVQDVKRISEFLKDSGYLVYSVVNELDRVSFYFLIFKVGLFLVGTIAVIIASIGIYNTMTMAVTERSREIGVMKAVGAHPAVIRRLFLLESSYIGMAGALVGVVIAYVVSSGVNLGLPLLFRVAFQETVPDWFRFSDVPASLTIISFLICAGIATLSGLRPSERATQVDVLQALRRDL